MSAQPLLIGAFGVSIDIAKVRFFLTKYHVSTKKSWEKLMSHIKQEQKCIIM